jgi:hypothetical protein
MTDQFNRQPTSPSDEKRVTSRKRGLSIDLPINSFPTALVNFNQSAEAFAMSLSHPQHRKFAYQYLACLQDIVHGSDQLKPSTSGRPDCRLIRAELERLFRCHFFRPDQTTSILK